MRDRGTDPKLTSSRRAYRLTEHADNKHKKTLKDCFPTFDETGAKVETAKVAKK